MLGIMLSFLQNTANPLEQEGSDTVVSQEISEGQENSTESVVPEGNKTYRKLEETYQWEQERRKNDHSDQLSDMFSLSCMKG